MKTNRKVFFSMSTILILGAVAVLIFTFGIPGIRHPELPWGQAGVEVCPAQSGLQHSPGIVPATEEDFNVITWVNENEENKISGVYSQKLDKEGVQQWDVNGKTVHSRNEKISDCISVSDNAGGSIIAWLSTIQNALNIFAQKINSEGNPQWPVGNPSNITIYANMYSLIGLKIVTDGAGGAIIAIIYEENVRVCRMRVQKVDATGRLLWGNNGTLVPGVVSTRSKFDMISDNAGGAILVWTDIRSDNSNIYAQRIDSRGQSLWIVINRGQPDNRGKPICVKPEMQDNPKMISDGANGAIIAWEDYTNANESDIYAVRIDSNGSKMQGWQDNGTIVCNKRGLQSLPVLVSDGKNGAIVIYKENNNLFAQRLDKAGAVKWPANNPSANTGISICAEGSVTGHYSILSDNNSGAVIFWIDNRDDTSAVYTQKIDENGGVVWDTNGEEICQNPDMYSVIVPISDNEGGYTAVFMNASSKITAQRIAEQPLNTAPQLTVNPKSVTVNEGSPLPQIQVTALDAEGDVLTYSMSGLPKEASINPQTGAISWTPGYDKAGTYNVTITVSDDGEPKMTDTETITVTVKNTNRAPTITTGDQDMVKGTQKEFIVEGNDPDGDVLTFNAPNLPQGATWNPTKNKVSWTPANAGNYNATLTATDGKLTTTKTIKITVSEPRPVNRAPVLTQIGNKTNNENVNLKFTISATDPDGNPLTYTASGLPNGATFTAATRTFNWTPSYTQAGSYRVTFTVADNGNPPLSASKTVTITVNNVNRAPKLTSPGDKTIEKGKVLEIFLNAADDDGDVLTFSYSSNPATPGANLDPVKKKFNWTPGNAGIYNVTFTVRDNGNPNLSDSKTIKITVTEPRPVNRAPVATAQNISTNEDTAKAITLSGTDPDGNILTYTVVTQPVHGRLSGNAPNVTYTPTANYNGADSFTFKVNDGTVDSPPATVRITVISVNDAPRLNIGNKSVDEEITLTIRMQDYARDPDGNRLTYSASGLPQDATFDANTGVFTWKPKGYQAGSYPVTFTVSDGTLTATERVTITVNNTVHEWPIDGVRVSGANTAYTSPYMAPDGRGGSFIVYSNSSRDRDNDTDLYVQRVNVDGVLQWANELAITPVRGAQSAPSIISDNAGGAIIAWKDRLTQIRAKRIDANGNTVQGWPQDGIVIRDTFNNPLKTGPQIVSDNNNGAIVAWSELRWSGETIYARKVEANGQLRWEQDGVTIGGTCNMAGFRMTEDAAGGAIISENNYGRAFKIDNIGVANRDPWPRDGVIIAPNNGFYFRMESDGNGGAIFAYVHQDGRQAPPRDPQTGENLIPYYTVYTQRIDRNGQLLWGRNGIAVSGQDVSTYPKIISDGGTGAIVCWISSNDVRSVGGPSNIYLQKVDVNGLKWPEGRPSRYGISLCDVEGSKTPYIKITSDNNSGAIIAWEDIRENKYDLYIQGVNANGTVKWLEEDRFKPGKRICTIYPRINGVPLYSYFFDLMPDTSNGAFVAWQQEGANYRTDIYVQRIGTNGNVYGR